RTVYRRMFQWFTFTAVVAAFACAIAAEDVIRLMAAPAFHGAADVVPLLVVTYVLLGIHLFFNAALLIRNRTGLVAAIALLTAAALRDLRAKARWCYESDRWPALLKVLLTDGTPAMILYRLMQFSRRSHVTPLEWIFNRLNSVFCGCIIGRGADFGPGFVLI